MTAEKSTLILPVENMDSEHCPLIVDKALATVPSIGAHHVELNNRSAVIESTTPVEAVRDAVKAIRDNGYEVPTLRRTFPVTGMACASCVSSVESMLLAQPGVMNAAVNLATNTVQVEYVPGVIDERRMRAAHSGNDDRFGFSRAYAPVPRHPVRSAAERPRFPMPPPVV